MATEEIYDVREAILSRLAEVLEDVWGVNSFYRNDQEIPETSRPAIVMFDGDEDTDEGSFNRSRPSHAPLIMNMMPEVYVLVSGGPEEVGPSLNTMRRRVLADVMRDPVLKDLVKDGEIRYEGLQTALALGRSMAGEMGMNFTFVYVEKLPDIDEEDTEGNTELPTDAVVLSGGIEGGGELSAHLTQIHHISASLEGGGNLRGHIFPPLILTGSIEGQGLFSGSITSPANLVGSIEGGGLLQGNADTDGTNRYLVGSVEGGGLLQADLTAADLQDQDVNDIADAMVPYPDVGRLNLISNLVSQLKAAGIWSKLDLLYVTAAHSEQASTINWINPGSFDLTDTITSIFTVDEGYSQASVLSTGFNPTADAIEFSLNDCHIGAYVDGQASSAWTETQSGQPIIVLHPRDFFSVALNQDNTSIMASSGFNGGHAIANRPDANTIRVYVDGSAIYTDTEITTSIPNGTMRIGNNGSIGTLRAAHLGSALSGSDYVNFTNILDEYMNNL